MQSLTFGDSDGLDTFAAGLEYLIGNDPNSGTHPFVAEIEFHEQRTTPPAERRYTSGKYGLADFLDGDDINPTKVLLRPYNAETHVFGPTRECFWVPLLEIEKIHIP